MIRLSVFQRCHRTIIRLKCSLKTKNQWRRRRVFPPFLIFVWMAIFSLKFKIRLFFSFIVRIYSSSIDRLFCFRGAFDKSYLPRKCANILEAKTKNHFMKTRMGAIGGRISLRLSALSDIPCLFNIHFLYMSPHSIYRLAINVISLYLHIFYK